jgi:uncharacterized protein (TIGR03086 family)
LATLVSVDEIQLLEGVLAGTAEVIEGVADDQWRMPTPCPEYSVEGLVDHIIGWAQLFEAGANGRSFDGDAAAFRHGADPAAEFRSAAAGIVAGWRDHGFDRQVRISSGELPAEMAFSMTLMEYLTHGWDLATATSQASPWSEEEAAATLRRAEATLPPQYRGEGMPFGPVVPVDEGAPSIDRLAGFMGRSPAR